ncbi:hypothetical protein BESB_013070 [Besnoitia besnoiti]|uniref:Protein kinase domain-containing protein n=1 Tax=Besnoitia besnoiti TaxID=94643 RepID=A0A2A9M404_BESBE|nr:hypothetical protein BESB_013070 [Besnoitia besnoiti]PFH32695.1 hypothetical protein BESB_013070 [Besnoitia besnoiti]
MGEEALQQAVGSPEPPDVSRAEAYSAGSSALAVSPPACECAAAAGSAGALASAPASAFGDRPAAGASARCARSGVFSWSSSFSSSSRATAPSSAPPPSRVASFSALFFSAAPDVRPSRFPWSCRPGRPRSGSSPVESETGREALRPEPAAEGDRVPATPAASAQQSAEEEKEPQESESASGARRGRAGRDTCRRSNVDTSLSPRRGGPYRRASAPTAGRRAEEKAEAERAGEAKDERGEPQRVGMAQFFRSAHSSFSRNSCLLAGKPSVKKEEVMHARGASESFDASAEFEDVERRGAGFDGSPRDSSRSFYTATASSASCSSSFSPIASVPASALDRGDGKQTDSAVIPPIQQTLSSSSQLLVPAPLVKRASRRLKTEPSRPASESNFLDFVRLRALLWGRRDGVGGCAAGRGPHAFGPVDFLGVFVDDQPGVFCAAFARLLHAVRAAFWLARLRARLLLPFAEQRRIAGRWRGGAGPARARSTSPAPGLLGAAGAARAPCGFACAYPLGAMAQASRDAESSKAPSSFASFLPSSLSFGSAFPSRRSSRTLAAMVSRPADALSAGQACGSAVGNGLTPLQSQGSVSLTSALLSEIVVKPLTVRDTGGVNIEVAVDPKNPFLLQGTVTGALSYARGGDCVLRRGPSASFQSLPESSESKEMRSPAGIASSQHQAVPAGASSAFTSCEDPGALGGLRVARGQHESLRRVGSLSAAGAGGAREAAGRSAGPPGGARREGTRARGRGGAGERCAASQASGPAGASSWMTSLRSGAFQLGGSKKLDRRGSEQEDGGPKATHRLPSCSSLHIASSYSSPPLSVGKSSSSSCPSPVPSSSPPTEPVSFDPPACLYASSRSSEGGTVTPPLVPLVSASSAPAGSGAKTGDGAALSGASSPEGAGFTPAQHARDAYAGLRGGAEGGVRARRARTGSCNLPSKSCGGAAAAGAPSGLSPPGARGGPPQATYYYFGETKRNKRHGWGMIVNDERCLLEAQWVNDTVLGWYVCYHEYATEFGYRELNDVAAVSVASDHNSFIVPVRPRPVDTDEDLDLRGPHRPQETSRGWEKKAKPGEFVACASSAAIGDRTTWGRRNAKRSSTVAGVNKVKTRPASTTQGAQEGLQSGEGARAAPHPPSAASAAAGPLAHEAASDREGGEGGPARQADEAEGSRKAGRAAEVTAASSPASSGASPATGSAASAAEAPKQKGMNCYRARFADEETPTDRVVSQIRRGKLKHKTIHSATAFTITVTNSEAPSDEDPLYAAASDHSSCSDRSAEKPRRGVGPEGRPALHFVRSSTAAPAFPSKPCSASIDNTGSQNAADDFEVERPEVNSVVSLQTTAASGEEEPMAEPSLAAMADRNASLAAPQVKSSPKRVSRQSLSVALAAAAAQAAAEVEAMGGVAREPSTSSFEEEEGCASGASLAVHESPSARSPSLSPVSASPCSPLSRDASLLVSSTASTQSHANSRAQGARDERKTGDGTQGHLEPSHDFSSSSLLLSHGDDDLEALEEETDSRESSGPLDLLSPRLSPSPSQARESGNLFPTPTGPARPCGGGERGDRSPRVEKKGAWGGATESGDESRHGSARGQEEGVARRAFEGDAKQETETASRREADRMGGRARQLGTLFCGTLDPVSESKTASASNSPWSLRSSRGSVSASTNLFLIEERSREEDGEAPSPSAAFVRQRRRPSTCIPYAASAAAKKAAEVRSEDEAADDEKTGFAASASSSAWGPSPASHCLSAEELERRKRRLRRGSTFPEFTTQENPAVTETVLCEGISRGGACKRPGVHDLHFGPGPHGPHLRASDSTKWSTNTFCQFLRMVGLTREASVAKLNHFYGADIPTLTREKLREAGIRDRYVQKFLLTVFRYLWSCSDHLDPLTPLNRRHLRRPTLAGRKLAAGARPAASAAPLTSPPAFSSAEECLRLIPATEVRVGRRTGGGGYATVHKARYRGIDVACKIFKYTPSSWSEAADHEDALDRASGGEGPRSPGKSSGEAPLARRLSGTSAEGAGGANERREELEDASHHLGKRKFREKAKRPPFSSVCVACSRPTDATCAAEAPFRGLPEGDLLPAHLAPPADSRGDMRLFGALLPAVGETPSPAVLSARSEPSGTGDRALEPGGGEGEARRKSWAVDEATASAAGPHLDGEPLGDEGSLADTEPAMRAEEAAASGARHVGGGHSNDENKVTRGHDAGDGGARATERSRGRWRPAGQRRVALEASSVSRVSGDSAATEVSDDCSQSRQPASFSPRRSAPSGPNVSSEGFRGALPALRSSKHPLASASQEKDFFLSPSPSRFPASPPSPPLSPEAAQEVDGSEGAASACGSALLTQKEEVSMSAETSRVTSSPSSSPSPLTSARLDERAAGVSETAGLAVSCASLCSSSARSEARRLSPGLEEKASSSETLPRPHSSYARRLAEGDATPFSSRAAPFSSELDSGEESGGCHQAAGPVVAGGGRGGEASARGGRQGQVPPAGGCGVASASARSEGGPRRIFPKLDYFRYCPQPLKHRDYEADILASLQPHPNIITLFGRCHLRAGEEALILEFCNLGSLDAFVYPPDNERRGGRKPWKTLSRPKLVHIFRDVAKGMAHVHSRHILHRDLKLSNILLDGDTAKASPPTRRHAPPEHSVADFGVATAFVANDSPSVLALFGNVFYAAPEVLRGDGFYPASDVWSYGVAFWEALTGKLAYEGFSAGYVFTRVAAGTLSLRIPSDFPPALRWLMARLLAFEPSERPSFEEVSQALCELEANAMSEVERDLDDFFGLG